MKIPQMIIIDLLIGYEQSLRNFIGITPMAAFLGLCWDWS